MDLICHRYPGIRPSEYLEIKDKLEAFNIDSASALRGFLQDEEKTKERIEILVESIHNVCRALGAKIKSRKSASKPEGKVILEKTYPRLIK